MERLHGCSCKDGFWEAWVNEMPPNTARELHVEGLCTCPRAGYQVRLVRANPQGINPEILLLNLEIDEPSGASADVLTDCPVEYRETNARYKQVTIVPCNITIDVLIVS
jgi:hypothetical protein